MPELPEVETVGGSLERIVAGRTIAEALVLRDQLRRPFLSDLYVRLARRRVEGVRRRGKYLLLTGVRSEI